MNYKVIYKQLFPIKSKLVIASGHAPSFGSPLGNIPLSSHSTCALHVLCARSDPRLPLDLWQWAQLKMDQLHLYNRCCNNILLNPWVRSCSISCVALGNGYPPAGGRNNPLLPFFDFKSPWITTPCGTSKWRYFIPASTV